MTEGNIEGFPLNYGIFLGADIFLTHTTLSLFWSADILQKQRLCSETWL